MAAFFVCFYPHQGEGPAQSSGSLLFARQVSNSTTSKCDLKSLFDFFPFRVGLKKLKTPAKRSTNRKSRGWGRGVIRRNFGLRLISVMCTVTGY